MLCEDSMRKFSDDCCGVSGQAPVAGDADCRPHKFKRNRNFAVILLGGTGQMGGATVSELLSIPECREVVMVTRKPIAARPRVRNVVLDSGAADLRSELPRLPVQL